MKLDYDLLPMKMHFFLFFGGVEMLRKFLPLIYRSKGVTEQGLGLMYSILPLVCILVTPVLGFLSDFLRARRTIFIISLAGLALANMAVYVLPNITDHKSRVLDVMENIDILADLNQENQTEVISTIQMLLGRVHSELSLSELLSCPKFWLLFLTHLGDQLCIGLSFTLADALCFRMIGKNSQEYGRQRMFGSFGLGMMALLGSLAVDLYSEGSANGVDYLPLFAVCFLFSALDLAVVAGMEVPKDQVELNVAKITPILLKPKNILFFLSMLLFGFCMNLMWVWKPLLVEDMAHDYDKDFPAHAALQGGMIFVQSLGALISFRASGWLIKGLGHFAVIILSFAAFGAHLVLLAVVCNPWCAVPLELLNGIDFCLLWATAASYASHIAPPQADATLQAFTKTAFHFGFAISGVGIGHAYQYWGPYTTFLLAGGAVASLVIMAGCTVLAIWAVKYLTCSTGSSEDKQHNVLVESNSRSFPRKKQSLPVYQGISAVHVHNHIIPCA